MKLITDLTDNSLKKLAKHVKDGKVVAFPTETVYGLGADANNSFAIQRVYRIKSRPLNHPLIVHISSIKLLNIWAKEIPKYAIDLATTFWPGAMTLILPRTNVAEDFITGGQNCVGIRVPSNSIAQRLINYFESLGGLGIAAPSANRFGKLSPTSASDVIEELESYTDENDLIINGGTCEIGLESTIINCTEDTPKVLRPGAITTEMIEQCIGIRIGGNSTSAPPAVSGSFNSHYAPNAKVYIEDNPEVGCGFLALADVSTPTGMVRLGSPKNEIEFARDLYHYLRQADKSFIKKVFIKPPNQGGLSLAINDRIQKMVSKKI